MRKFMVIALPIVTLVLFVMVMLSSNILKQPLGNDDNIPQSIETVVQDINHENWGAANQATENLNRVWDKVVTRVQFSAERNELDDLTMNIARLKGCLLYTSDAADEEDSVDLGGRRIIKKQKQEVIEVI